MFLRRHTQDGSASGYLLHSEFVACLRDRKDRELAAYFAPAGLMRVSDIETGAIIEEAHGREGVQSLGRLIHENVALMDFSTRGLRWIAGGVDYAWIALVRNWGFGPARAASVRARLEFSGGSIRRADLMFDRDVWFALVRPGAQWRQAGALAV